jgi:uncharacterized membrane protein YagU involved in acid resistance
VATSSTTHAGSTALERLVPAVGIGVVGGLVGGVVFGALMQMMDMIHMVAMLVGSTSVAVGWLVHLAISAFIGATFAVLFGRFATTTGRAGVLGLGYGVLWWVVGALLLMPAKLGMTAMIFHVGKTQWQSLVGHLVYGLLLGLVFGLLAPRLARRGQ